MNPNQQDDMPQEPAQSPVPPTDVYVSPQPVAEQQQPQFQQPVSQPPVAQPAATPASAENPGQTLGIVSLVLDFIGFSLIGMILGIISRKKSKAVGAPTTLGTIGMILGIVFTVIGILAFLLVALTSYAGLQQLAKDKQRLSAGSSSASSGSESKSNALSANAFTVAKHAEAFAALSGDYPETTSDFSKYPESALPSDIKVYSSLLLTNTSLTYIYCGEGSAQVAYLGTTTEDKKIVALGSASSTEVCSRSF